MNWLIFLILRNLRNSEVNVERCFCPVETSCFWSSASGMSLIPDLARTYTNWDHTSSGYVWVLYYLPVTLSKYVFIHFRLNLRHIEVRPEWLNCWTVFCNAVSLSYWAVVFVKIKTAICIFSVRKVNHCWLMISVFSLGLWLSGETIGKTSAFFLSININVPADLSQYIIQWTFNQIVFFICTLTLSDSFMKIWKDFKGALCRI